MHSVRFTNLTFYLLHVYIHTFTTIIIKDDSLTEFLAIRRRKQITYTINKTEQTTHMQKFTSNLLFPYHIELQYIKTDRG